MQAKPLSVNLYGEKGWSNIYPFIIIIRIPEIIEIYRKNGMPIFKYFLLKNYSLKTFFPYMYYILKNKKISNYKYISFKKNIIKNFLYPNIYIYGIFYTLRKIYYKIYKIFDYF